METKECIKCQNVKPIENYHFDKITNKYINTCKICCSRRKKLQAEINKNIVIDYSIETFKNCPSCKITKSSFQFTKSKQNKGGLATACAECCRKITSNNINKYKVKNENLNIDQSRMKRCPMCKITMQKINFDKSKSKYDGLSSQCKKCISDFNKNRKEKFLILNKNKSEDDFIKEKLCFTCKIVHPTTNFKRRWGSKDSFEYQCKNCSKNTHNKRRDMKLNNVLITSEEEVSGLFIQELKEKYEFSCAYCKIKPELIHIDHMHPLSRGGGHIKSNLIPACRDCNLRKNAKPLDQWLKEINKTKEEVIRK